MNMIGDVAKSMRAARCAGSVHATRAADPRQTTTATYASGSVGEISNSSPSRKRDTAAAPASEAVLAHEPTQTTAEGQARDARVRDDSARSGETECLCVLVEVAPQNACLRLCCPLFRIDLNAPHLRKVDYDSSVARAISCSAVATLARYRQGLLR